MKDYKTDFTHLVRQLLPQHKRQPIRLAILCGFVAPLIALYASFCVWRNKVRKLLNVTCQVGILTQFLRDKYDDATITIESFREMGFAVGLRPEGIGTAQGIGFSAAEGSSAMIPLRGELRNKFGDVDFVVRILATTNIDAVRADIERYRPALTTYKIEQR